MNQSTQYQDVMILRPLHILRRFMMQSMSVPKNPYSFSICNMMMHFQGYSWLHRCYLMMGATASKQILTSSMKCLLLDRRTNSGLARSRAGMPPKSHSAQTQGPGRMSTFISCFSARVRNNLRFLLSVVKSNLPLSISWQFHMMQTLRALSPIALIIMMRCSQYSTGMRAQWTSPAQILGFCWAQQLLVSTQGLKGWSRRLQCRQAARLAMKMNSMEETALWLGS